MYIYVTHLDSRNTFFANEPLSFHVQIQPPIHLDPNENWTCALMECDFGEEPEDIFEKNLYIYCDLINPSVVKGKYQNLLRVVDKSRIFSLPYFIPITRTIIDQIHFQIRTLEGNKPSDTPHSTRLVLKIEKK